MLTLKWYGHSMWSIFTNDCHIVIDPFTDIGFDMPENLSADIVISSHDHFDHNNFKLILPNFQKITQIGTYQLQNCKVKLIETSHGKLNDKNLGDTFLSLICINNASILHCGDLGIIPSTQTIKEIGTVDILLVPVGGQYTIDAAKAKEFIEIIQPRYVFPMHYRTAKSKIDIIDTIEPFVELYPNIEEINSNSIDIDTEALNETEQRIVKLNYE